MEKTTMQISDEHIHDGHRSRMRSKLREHGERIFDTYELLEMLLYYVVPYRDTNPIAKRLLARFGSLDAVFMAKKEELMEIDGIGETAAGFLLSAGTITALFKKRDSGNESLVFDNFDVAGEYFVKYFDEHLETNIVVLLLDDCMRMLGVEKIPGKNFGSASVHPKYFISAALKYRASMAIVAYTHRGNVAYPYSGDYETARMLRHELSLLGVNLVEQFVVGAGDYNGSSLELHFGSTPSVELLRFVESKEAACRKRI